MATLIPSLNSCLSKMQAGEKRFARRLEQLLEDDYLCWYEIPVGKKQRYTDFVVLHPIRGLLFLEVKDWKLDTIQKIDKQTTTIFTPVGLKVVTNPLEQARQCAYQLINQLSKDPQLIQRNGHYQGKLIFPYGYGVVLSNITRKQFNATDLKEVLPEHQVICKDEMQENSEPEAFQKHLWDMFNIQFGRTLSLPQIDRIRWHLFPEIRINGNPQQDLFTKVKQSDEDKSSENLIPELVKLMDLQQEQLARSLGDGHRIIHGVAGSGKTLILGYRSLYLARILSKPILVLCYNITLAARLRQLMLDHDINHKVSVYHFHDWCGEQLTRYQIEKPKHSTKYFDRLVEKVIESTESGQIPKGQYGAIMIDEGHDFQADWLKLITAMVDPDSNSLLLLYDDAQSIYNKGNLNFSLSSVGIQARGRTKILRINYRNTDEILTFAYNFASQYFKAEDSDDDHIPLIEPKPMGRNGAKPVIKILNDYDQELLYIIHIFKKLHSERSIPWSEMCITYRSKWMGKKIQTALTNAGIPTQWLGSSKKKREFNPSDNSVKIMTMHSSKGLEFPVMAVSGIGYLPAKGQSEAAEAKLLYVAMTRSTDILLLTSHDGGSEFTERICNQEIVA